MKKAFKFTTGLSLQILFLGAIGFFGTFFSDYLSSIGWFSDFKNEYGRIEWGARHCWYVWTLITLSLVQVVRIIIWAILFWDSELEAIINEENQRRITDSF